MRPFYSYLSILFLLFACSVEKNQQNTEMDQASIVSNNEMPAPILPNKVLNVGFLAINGVYNSELMAVSKPSIPKGTRDFGPVEMNRRVYILETIKAVYKKYGFQQLETPTLENLSVLTGKYGDEGDQLLFKVLNSGDYLKKTSIADYESGAKNLIPKIAEKGLRYDLTVPFARYVVMNRGTLSFPFKRFQIQPVWRADRPQKGRYREFYQCDADVIGTTSLICEAEIVGMLLEVFETLRISGIEIKINNRKILAGIAQACRWPW